MSNVIPLPGLSVEMQLSEIEGLIDAMLFMHESAGSGDRERIINICVTLLYVMKDKCRAGQNHLQRMPSHYGRSAVQ